MTTKIAISLPDEQVTEAKAAVAQGRAASVSAYISDALAQRQRSETLARLLTDLDREDGPPPTEAVEEAKRALQRW